MDDCLFCKIAAGFIPSELILDRENVVAFRDINPQAPTHILIIPRKHIATLNDLEENDAELMGEMVLAAKDLAEQEGIAESGYRTGFNCNADAGQTVWHVHLHLMGGRKFNWPPG
ncbi:MAG: histidine triad nucleotide-binding protein [Candidatus Marinimicrobia bacterium]|jgi:histidine triad (HIT) family protein|nr:histidine triad nucleotide-binding protein [Candidatus Neomarinimicrobiota bacterium]MBT3618379.1 histidine triad nucleotide-binding protein [Candidatus Neomarinimicrobiota bacterium]MBT3829174.1 histidine triad nucleotide-binding protein [Candidatus Neomarinimicrobiota bacterium]MBT3998142.1 histidine triad nucleotide-binding protein [Candidatus Neomarinimicrobiota bacterium]MBT4281483.1 histidine triad nucleotide-binding protein [Candidatus Neomarinimicrobiota bacterium]